ncbi:Tim44-like domain protein [Enhygromyxa salina]|uniref:Tim44-like domain protein n=1 Tax=Enhygromyxa salina TaxID=215803 RepID=A0A2S9XFI7_9BACT|nr:TIM44-like domain-containing protein [Enhygromyxa salina]PRP91441.1 Tim44-like domain protein [Enhygromyxa salina]
MSSWRRRLGPQMLVWIVLMGAGLLAAELAEARPGGGQSYSGSSYSGSSYSGYSGSGYSGYSSGSYSGGGGGGELGGCGLAGVLLLMFIGTASNVLKFVAKTRDTWDSHTTDFTPPPPPRARAIDWQPLLARDPHFSSVVFEDFAYQLYARVHEARGDAEAMASLAPYVVPGVRETLARREPVGAKISNVVIGSMQVTALELGGLQTVVTIRFESNLSAAGSLHYVVEQWRLSRGSKVTSKPPDQALALKCPNCGAPFESTDDQRCDYCGEVVSNGRFDWHLIGTRLLTDERRPPALGGYAPELGTERPTLVSPRFARAWSSLVHDDPRVERGALQARIERIYDHLNTAWAARDLTLARPYLSDGIHDYLRYWIEAYERQKLINCLEDMRIETVEFVKLTRDEWYDALTVRIFASGLDYTIRAHDKTLVGGSPTKRRRYSEYWTVIRGAGVRGEARDDSGCPNCGAPLTVNMAGNCERCAAHLTRGEFDWVLSRIEQDESYLG